MSAPQSVNTMNDAALFYATVPVFQHYAERIGTPLSVLPDEHSTWLEQRLAPNALTAGEHLQTALGFVSRTVFPLLGRHTP